MRLVVRPAAGRLRGEARVPGDKSIAHRWLLMACTAEGSASSAGCRPRSTCAPRPPPWPACSPSCGSA